MDKSCFSDQNVFEKQLFLCNRDALLQMDEGYKQMGRSDTHKEEDA